MSSEGSEAVVSGSATPALSAISETTAPAPLGALSPTPASVTRSSATASPTPASISPSRTLSTPSLLESLTIPVSTAVPASNSSKAPAVHTVYVGNGAHRFVPNTTYANPGDIVSFVFYPTNHSIIRAAYGFPCVPYEETFPGKTGFFSGHFLTNGTGSLPVWNLTINSTETLWYYCTALGSCTPNGMIGVINPPTNASTALATQEDLAVNAQYQLEPGQSAPLETALAQSSTTSATPTMTSTLTSSTPSSSIVNSTSNPAATISHGGIAGIVVGAIVGLMFIAAAIYYCGRNSVYRQWYKSEKKTQSSTESWLSGQTQYQYQQKEAQLQQQQQQQPQLGMSSVATGKARYSTHESYVDPSSSGPISPPMAEAGWWSGNTGGQHGRIEEMPGRYEVRAQNYNDPAELEGWRRQ